MNEYPVAKTVRKIIANELEKSVEQITDDKHFINDLGADSIDLVEIGLKVENRFGFKIPPKDYDKLITVVDWINYVQSYINIKS